MKWLPTIGNFRWFLTGLVIAASSIAFAAYTNFKPVLIVDSSYAGNSTPVLVVDVNGTPAAVTLTNKTAFPSSPTTGQIVAITDDSVTGACDSAAGAALSLCYWNGTSWVNIGGGATEVDTLDTVFDRGKTVDGANSLANAVRIGDGTTPICLYTDATLGPQVRPCTDANTRTIIPTNFNWCAYDIEGASCILTIDPDAASVLDMWQIASAYRWKKAIWFPAGNLSTDGTQCTDPAERTPVASGPKLFTIICADNDGSTIHGVTKMPDNWSAGTLFFTQVYQQTAADTGVLNGDIAAQCRGNGEAPSSTYGTEVAIDDAAVVGSGANDMTTSAAVTATGTCAAGDMLYWRYQLDATGTTTAVATLHTLGFFMYFTEVGPSQ